MTRLQLNTTSLIGFRGKINFQHLLVDNTSLYLDITQSCVMIHLMDKVNAQK